MSRAPSQTHPDESPVLALDLRTNREAPSVARAAIAGFSEDRDLGESTLATLTLLVSEVVTNAVIHPEVDDPRRYPAARAVRRRHHPGRGHRRRRRL